MAPDGGGVWSAKSPPGRGGPLSIISIFLLKRIDFGNLRGSYVEGIAGVVLMPSQVSCTIQKASDTYQNLDIADDMERLRFKGSLLKRPKPKKNVVPSAPKKLPISLPKNDQISNFLAKRGRDPPNLENICPEHPPKNYQFR